MEEKTLKKAGNVIDLDKNIIKYFGHDGHIVEIKSDGSIYATDTISDWETKPLGNLSATTDSVLEKMQVSRNDTAECIAEWLKENLSIKIDSNSSLFNPETWISDDKTDMFTKLTAKNRQMALESDEYKSCGFRVGSKVRLSDKITRYEP